MRQLLIWSSKTVDDLIQSVPSAEVAVSLAENVQNILQQGGFHIKHWLMSGGDEDLPVRRDINILNVSKEKILGMCWIPQNDLFTFQAKISFSPKRNNLPTEPDLTEANINEAFPQILTRRMVLSQAARIYDPIGFLAPVTLTAKILMRKLISQPVEGNGKTASIAWDAPISDQNRNSWKSFFEDLFKLKDVTFIRCLKPEDAIGDPTLIVFSDASIQAYGACAYVQWELKTGTFEARLIAAKHT